MSRTSCGSVSLRIFKDSSESKSKKFEISQYSEPVDTQPDNTNIMKTSRINFPFQYLNIKIASEMTFNKPLIYSVSHIRTIQRWRQYSNAECRWFEMRFGDRFRRFNTRFGKQKRPRIISKTKKMVKNRIKRISLNHWLITSRCCKTTTKFSLVHPLNSTDEWSWTMLHNCNS